MSTTGQWQEFFGGRHWRVAEEVSGIVVQDGAQVRFDRGQFEVQTPGFAYRSPLSTNLALRGTLLHETDETGEHDIPGSRLAIGTPAVKIARRDFGAVW